MWTIGYAGAFKKDLKLLKKHGYDIELSDGTEIDFNTKFKVTKVDR